MGFNSLKDVLQEQLEDLHSAETQLVEALPKMARSAHHDELRLPDYFLEIEVDRKVVLERHKVCEPELKSARDPVPGARERGKLAVGRGKDDDIARGLPEIDGFGAAVEEPCLDRKTMH